MKPKKTPFAQKFLRGLIALLLIGAAVLYFTNPLHADELDLTLPETPFDYEQMNKDSKLIKDWEERNYLVSWSLVMCRSSNQFRGFTHS